MNPLLAVCLALTSATIFATFTVMARRAMGETTAFAGAFITLLVGLPLLIALSFVFSTWSALTPQVALWFVLSGVLAPGLGRLLLFLGIRTIGVGRTMPLITLTPFLSTLLAVAWLGERPGVEVWFATACVAAGCALITMKPEGDSDWRRIFLLLPIFHSVVVAGASTMRRQGLLLLPDPVLGATLANASSIPVMWMMSYLLPKSERFRVDRKKITAFIGIGVLNTLGYLVFFTAFRYGEVSIVVPVSYSAPLFSLVFARVWLREEERITWQKTVGAVLLFIGMASIVWYAAL